MLTIYSWFGYNIPIKERCRLIKQAGFDGVMIWWNDDFDKIDFRSQPEDAHNAGLFVENMHTPYDGNTNLWLDNLEGEEIEKRLIDCIEDCSTYQIPTMVVHPTSGNPPPVNEIALNRFKRIAEKAEQKGINIAMENIKLIDYLKYILDSIHSNRLGFCYDSGHHNSKTPKCDILTEYSSRLMALHLHDNIGYVVGEKSEDQHRLPFDGNIDWARTMKIIANSGYDGANALEVLNLGYEHLAGKPEEFLSIAYERAKRLDELRKGWEAAR